MQNMPDLCGLIIQEILWLVKISTVYAIILNTEKYVLHIYCSSNNNSYYFLQP